MELKDRIEDKMFAILSKELQLDMPKPVAAKRRVVNDITALIDAGYYEKEFVSYLSSYYAYIKKDNKYVSLISITYLEQTAGEVYKFWSANIKEK